MSRLGCPKSEHTVSPGRAKCFPCSVWTYLLKHPSLLNPISSFKHLVLETRKDAKCSAAPACPFASMWQRDVGTVIPSMWWLIRMAVLR